MPTVTQKTTSFTLGFLFALTCVLAPAVQAGAEPGATVTKDFGEVDKKPEPSKWKEVWNMVKVGTLWYLAYGFGEDKGAAYNGARVGRGYLTVKFEPVKWFTPRITLDTHQDDEGDWKVRLKYLYGKFRLPIETDWITEPDLEFGIVHTPWFDFEEHVNWYRMQGTMFIERNKLLNSADLGFTLGGLIGRKLDKEYRERVNPKYPGKYGSFALGLYNGSGYHAEEQNQNKVFESRLTLRPLGFVIPGLQFSYLFIFGKGNTEEEPDWMVHDVMGSYEHEYFVLTAQYATGKGNQAGDKIDANGDALDFQGFSVFGEIKLPWIKSTLIGRYDYWDWGVDQDSLTSQRFIGGYAFHFLKHNFVLLSYDRVSYSDDTPDSWQATVTLQVKYPPK
jgi:hypothetical protein